MRWDDQHEGMNRWIYYEEIRSSCSPSCPYETIYKATNWQTILYSRTCIDNGKVHVRTVANSHTLTNGYCHHLF
jgi:hypothetical protein